MEDNQRDSVPVARQHLDFPTLLIDQGVAGSPMTASSTATPPPTMTPTTVSCHVVYAGHKDTVASRYDDGNDEKDKSNIKCPVGPSRMVTRSQTAAVRRHPYSQLCHNIQCDQKDVQEDKEAHPGSCDSMSDDDMAELNDLPSDKSSPRSGIEMGSVCHRCGAVLMTVTSRIAHNAAHDQEGAHCKYCQQGFITTHGRDAHQHLHDDSRTIDVDDYCECVLCGGAFISVMNLEFHLLELHGRPALLDPDVFRMGIASGGEGDTDGEGVWALYHCGVCGQKFMYSFNLDCHMVLHSKEIYCCTVCDSSFPCFDHLMSHIRSHRQPALFAPVIHVPTTAPVSATSVHTSPQPSVNHLSFSLPTSKRKSDQLQTSSHLSTNWDPRNAKASTSLCCQISSSDGGGDLHATQTLLRSITSHSAENVGSSRHSSRGAHLLGSNVLSTNVKGKDQLRETSTSSPNSY